MVTASGPGYFLHFSWLPMVLELAVAIIGYVYDWPIEVLATILSIVLVAGLVSVVVGAREKELEKSSYFQTVTISSANQSPKREEVSFELKLELLQ